jgi:orotate phosphoribosyltransferase
MNQSSIIMNPPTLALPSLLSTAPFLLEGYDPNTASLLNPHRVRTSAQWEQTYRDMGAYWAFDYDRPHNQQCHAQLTSGNCSDMFFNSGVVTSNPLRLAEATRDLFYSLYQAVPEELRPHPDRFVGCASGAITLAHDAARISTEFPGWEGLCARSSFVEKTTDGGMHFMRTAPTATELVVACEDVFTTGGSLRTLLNEVRIKGATLAPYALVLVNRNGDTEFEGLQIISLITKKSNVWAPADCPLCAAGSRPVRPKQNWLELTRPT